MIAKVGAGKTVCSLTAAAELLAEGVLTRVLVIAPLKVCDNVWRHEHEKWAHLQHLKVSVATGDAKKRVAAIASSCDILVLNIENIKWFVDKYRDGHGCDGLIVDELSKFKNVGGTGFKKLRRRVRDFKWRVGMTGTPVSEDWTGLYGQMLIVDEGKTFGTNQQTFLDSYFYPTDYQRRNWALRAGADAQLTAAMGDLVYTVPDYRDELPPVSYVTEVVTLPDDARAVYDTMKNEMLVELESGVITAANAAVLSGKLTQAASGFLYDTEAETTATLHTAKLDRLKAVVSEYDEPVLIIYWFQHDKEAIQAAFDCPIYGDQSKAKTQALEAAWNRGEVPVMMLHPRSGGHGVNIQGGGAVEIWYGPQWSRDLWEQTIGRLHRKGQDKSVEVVVIEAANTVDQVITARVDDKGEFDKLLMAHLQSD